MSLPTATGASSSGASTDNKRFWCHTCECRIDAVFHPRDDESGASMTDVSDELDDQPTCPLCGDCFVERLDQDDDDADTTTPPVAGTNNAPQPTSAPVGAPAPPTPFPPMFPFPLPGFGGAIPAGGPAAVPAAFNPAQMMMQLMNGMFQPMQTGAPANVQSPAAGEQLLPSHPPVAQSFQFTFPTAMFGAPAVATPAAAAPPAAQVGQPTPPAQALPPQQPAMPINPFQFFNPFAQLLQPPMQQANPFGALFGGASAPMPTPPAGAAANPFGPLFQLFGLPPPAPLAGGANGPHRSDYFFGDLNQLMHNLMMNGQSGRVGSPPASAAAVAALQDIKLDDTTLAACANTDCSVCLDAFAVGDTVKQLPCRHAYHSDCLMPWLREHNSWSEHKDDRPGGGLARPSCRYLLPTDDPAYEQRRAQVAQTAMEQAQAAQSHSSSSAPAGTPVSAAQTASSSSASAVGPSTPPQPPQQ